MQAAYDRQGELIATELRWEQALRAAGCEAPAPTDGVRWGDGGGQPTGFPRIRPVRVFPTGWAGPHVTPGVEGRTTERAPAYRPRTSYWCGAW